MEQQGYYLRNYSAFFGFDLDDEDGQKSETSFPRRL